MKRSPDWRSRDLVSASFLGENQEISLASSCPSMPRISMPCRPMREKFSRICGKVQSGQPKVEAASFMVGLRKERESHSVAGEDDGLSPGLVGTFFGGDWVVEDAMTVVDKEELVNVPAA